MREPPVVKRRSNEHKLTLFGTGSSGERESDDLRDANTITRSIWNKRRLGGVVQIYLSIEKDTLILLPEIPCCASYVVCSASHNHGCTNCAAIG